MEILFLVMGFLFLWVVFMIFVALMIISETAGGYRSRVRVRLVRPEEIPLNF